MKVTQLRLAGQGAWPKLTVDRCHPELNVFTSPPRSGKSTLAQLAAHLLYGKADGASRGTGPTATPLIEGSIEVTAPQGTFLLRRHRDGSDLGRLSIASASGATVDGRTIRALLSDVSPKLLAELYVADFARPASASTLLAGEFARQFTRALGRNEEPAPAACPDAERSLAAEATLPDRARVDELVRRRDAVMRQIEEHLSGSRRASDALRHELEQLEQTLAERRRSLEPLQAKLRTAEARLAEIAATLRFFSLETAVRRGSEIDDQRLRDDLERLDAEIARTRQTLSDLQQREAAVRRELAELHPDGAADGTNCLADQRVTVGVFERLIDDLDAEVAQLARAHEPGRCVGLDAHARLSPVVQMIRQQLYTLCGQVTEHERAARRTHLNIEARQLTRAQTDIGEQLEHLLQRRQALVHESQLAQRPVVLLPQAPADAHCQCRSHGDFVRNADAMLLARTDRARREQSAQAQRVELERQRDELRAACDAAQREIDSLDARWRRLQRDRAQPAERTSLDDLRRELERLETAIHRALSEPQPIATAAAAHRRFWKASDVLAQLTDGQLAEIRVTREGADATVIDRDGRSIALADLSAPERDQAYLSLILALTSSLSQRGIDLPLILDEPFLRQDARGAAAMAGVLDEFARQGRQVFVFTENHDAVRRFASLGVAVRNLDELRRRDGEAAPAVCVVAEPDASVAPSAVRIVREAIDSPQPALRVASPWTPADEDREVYYLTPAAAIADFPVLGNDTAAAFAPLGIETVADLLAADAEQVANRLQRKSVTSATVRLWQSHMSLMCFVPGVSLNDAQVLAACDVSSPESLTAADSHLLAADVERFLASAVGRRFASLRTRFTAPRLHQLQRQARAQRVRWSQARPAGPSSDAPPSAIAAVAEAARPRPLRSAAPCTPAPRLAAPRPAQRQPLRFLLDRSSPVADAPSIGDKTAELLANIGIRTVADLLHANPESAAHDVGQHRITAEVVARWQREARLACCIPELRCGGAQLLVACGYAEPSQVAAADLATLYAKVRDFCRTPHGKRLLRDGKTPSRERVAQWIRHAAHMRPLEAA